MAKRNPLLIILAISAFFFLIFMAVAIGMVMSISSGGMSRQHALFSGNSKMIGVIEIKGIITDSKKTLEQIDFLSEDQSVKGVVVRINSPGGSVAPSQEIYEALRELAKKKPVYASMSSLAASGGY